MNERFKMYYEDFFLNKQFMTKERAEKELLNLSGIDEQNCKFFIKYRTDYVTTQKIYKR